MRIRNLNASALAFVFIGTMSLSACGTSTTVASTGTSRSETSSGSGRGSDDGGASGRTEERLNGRVTNLDTSSQSFSVGSTRVSFLKSRVSGLLTDGVDVRVEGNRESGLLVASRVKADDDGRYPLQPGASVVLTDEIEVMQPQAGTFAFEHYDIDYSGVAQMPTLRLELKVRVIGKAAPGGRTIRAEHIVVEDD